MTHPLITIGVTTYNAQETIERCLLSALSQDWAQVEVLVVDDCSSDQTLDIVDQVSQNFKNIRVFKNLENCGVAVSRNRILDEAQGEFVVFFDDDDVSALNRISVQYSRIVEYETKFAVNAPVICHTARHVIYPHGQRRIEPTMGQMLGRRAPAGPAVARRILLGKPLEDGYGACPTCSQMARLSTYRLVGGFDEQLRRGEDTDFNIRLALAGGHFVGVSQPLVTQMMTSTSEKSLDEEFRNMRILMKKNLALMDEASQSEFCLSWLDEKYAWLAQQPLTAVQELLSLAFRHPLLTMRRLAMSLRNLRLNRAFSRFHTLLQKESHSQVANNGLSRRQ